LSTWGPLVLVAPEPAPPPPDVAAPEVHAAFVAAGMDGLVHWGRHSWDVACNWKVFVDNYLDGGYHVAIAHPGLAGQLDLDAYETRVYARSSLQTAGGADARIGGGALYGWLYPNIMLNRYGPVLDVNVVYPTGPRTCRVLFDYWFTPDALADEAFVAASVASSVAT
ncbi:MAG: hypothetical protein KC910_39115, partial [Candidatus Eremiobacteraeota bacterium]|nr:hypothetical protein [Candidatus Eremiobacteraeota bacterium]